jgi:hypothetical protein
MILPNTRYQLCHNSDRSPPMERRHPMERALLKRIVSSVFMPAAKGNKAWRSAGCGVREVRLGYQPQDRQGNERNGAEYSSCYG